MFLLKFTAMSIFNNVPLGDGSFSDNGYTSPNNWGVDIDYYTDLWTGQLGHQANIPNPPMSSDWPSSWGGSDNPLIPYVPPQWPRKPDLPPPSCVIGCEPQNPPTDVVPEPGTGLLLAGAAMLALVAGRLRK